MHVIDKNLNLSQESYSLLAKFGIQVAREEAEKVDTFRYSWQKLQTLGVSLSENLLSKVKYNTVLSKLCLSENLLSQSEIYIIIMFFLNFAGREAI